MLAPESKSGVVKVGALIMLSVILGKLVSIPSNIYVAAILSPEFFGIIAIVNR